MFITKLSKKIISISFLVFLLLFFGVVGGVYAQQEPGGDQLGPIGPVGETGTLEAARDTVWNSILGKEGGSVGPVANVLSDGDVLLSGLMDVEGQEVLYIGVDEEVYDERIDALKVAFEREFPNVPVHIEPTDGVQLDSVAKPISFTRAANLSIPDNTDRQGTTSRITVPNSVRIGSMSVSVNITHTYIGDLKVDLVAPNGTVIVLHNRAGGATANLSATYTTALSGLANQPANGAWTLRVGDYAGGDVGTLVSWGLTIRPTTATSPTQSAIFSDDFTSGIGSKWSRVAGGSTYVRSNWITRTIDRSIDGYDTYDANNIVLGSSGCGPTPCSITLRRPISLSGYSSAYLSFHRFVDEDLDNGEYLKVEIGNNGVYRELDRWTPEAGEDDDLWHHEVYNLSSYLTSTNLTVRFTSKQSSSSEIVAIDNFMISQQAPTSPSQLSCFGGLNKTSSMVGGDRVVPRTNSKNVSISCGTITVGGVTTKDGKRGFVTSAHVVDDNKVAVQTNSDIWVGHRSSKLGQPVYTPLGRVDDMPFSWSFVKDGANLRQGDDTILADAAFVEYPRTKCAQYWGGYCFKYTYAETVIPSKVRTYTVEGSQLPRVGLAIRAFGATTRQERVGAVKTGKMLWSPSSYGGIATYVYYYTQSVDSVFGDSGGPIYTTPTTGNKVKLVGIHVGAVKVNTANGLVRYGVFSSWKDVEKTLSLESL